MRRINIIWKCFIFIMLTGTMVSVSSCSNDDEEESKKKEELDVDNEPAQDFEGLSINLQLLNSDSVAMKSFKEGEDIILKLTISNSKNETALLPPISDVANDLFHVYTKAGIDLGKPWDAHADSGGSVWPVYSTIPVIFYCVWDGKIDFDINKIATDGDNGLFRMWQTKVHNKLPKGSYYIQFDLPIDTKGNVITCKKQFEIK